MEVVLHVHCIRIIGIANEIAAYTVTCIIMLQTDMYHSLPFTLLGVYSLLQYTSYIS